MLIWESTPQTYDTQIDTIPGFDRGANIRSLKSDQRLRVVTVLKGTNEVQESKDKKFKLNGPCNVLLFGTPVLIFVYRILHPSSSSLVSSSLLLTI